MVKTSTMVYKILVIGVIVLFVHMCLLPVIVSESSVIVGDRVVIIVDDEGDGDHTSIKEALSHANPDDTIEVYSGIYPEQGIRIIKDNVTLLGISYELGEGDDSGKPIINNCYFTYMSPHMFNPNTKMS